MKKRGFTLIEIIICISLLAIIGVSSIIVVSKTTSNNFKSIEKQILTAADTYINIEKDDNGKTFFKGINNGGQGVILPLSKLVDKGYINDDAINKIKKEKGNDAVKDNYVLALLGDGTEENDCTGVTLKISWDNSIQEEVYLCPTNKTSSESSSDKIYVYYNYDLPGIKCEDEIRVQEFNIGEDVIFHDPICKSNYYYNMHWIGYETTENNINKVADEIDFGFECDFRENIGTLENSIYLKLIAYDKPFANVITDIPCTSDEGCEDVDEFLFSKDASNNYVYFLGKTWRIIGVDKNGYVKIIMDDNIGFIEKTSNNLSDVKTKIDEKLAQFYDNMLYEDSRYDFDITLLDENDAKKLGVGTGAVNNSFLKVGYSYWINGSSTLNVITNGQYVSSFEEYGSEFDDYLWECVGGGGTIYYGTYENHLGTPFSFTDYYEGYKHNYAIRPVIYLNENVSVKEGDGSKNNPYILW